MIEDLKTTLMDLSIVIVIEGFALFVLGACVGFLLYQSVFS